MPTSDDTILRCLKRRVKARGSEGQTLVGVGDCAWRKGSTYGITIVHLERREVVDRFLETAGMTAAHSSWPSGLPARARARKPAPSAPAKRSSRMRRRRSARSGSAITGHACAGEIVSVMSLSPAYLVSVRALLHGLHSGPGYVLLQGTRPAASVSLAS